MKQAAIRKALGSFGKGIAGAVSINVGLSGGRNCPTTCRHHPDSQAPQPTYACYAARLEGLYSSYQRNLAAREAMPLYRLCGMALRELQQLEATKLLPPWVRFCVSGSMPPFAELSALDKAQLVTLLRWLAERKIPVHLPIADPEEAERYRQLVGALVVVRESVQSAEAFLDRPGAVSFVVGSSGWRHTWRERIGSAAALAKARTRHTGRKCIVCPAIAHGWLKRWGGMAANPNAKCGGCDACARGDVDVVYPLH